MEFGKFTSPLSSEETNEDFVYLCNKPGQKCYYVIPCQELRETCNKVNGKSFKVHLDGYNQMPLLTGESTESAREEVYFFDDDGNLNAFRYKRWKMHFRIQENHGFDVWQKGYTDLRFPMLMDLYGDPYERASHDSEDYNHWMAERMFMLVPAQAYIAKFLGTFKDYPQRQAVGSFSLDKVLKNIENASKN